MRSGTISSFHRRLTEEYLSRLLAYEVEVLSTLGWQKRMRTGEVLFDLVPVERYRMDRTLCNREKGECCVCPIDIPGRPPQTIWASWHECWVSGGEGEFTLRSASWSFFRGRFGVDRKEQLLRAEWGADADLMKGKAAQPHWHFDRHQAGAVYESSEQVTASLKETQPGDAADKLEEIGVPPRAVALEDVDLGGIHLGMGGWKNSVSCQEPKDCWQCQPKDTGDLLAWAAHTLSYMKQQLERLRPEQV